jgi:Carboxypeptidase regulatory-like domain
MHHHRSVAIAALGFVLFAVALVSASITGGISGVVRDKSGAVISAASVVAIDTQTAVRTTVTTDAKGFCNLPRWLSELTTWRLAVPVSGPIGRLDW